MSKFSSAQTPTYEPPRIVTLAAGDIVASIGPASAGSSEFKPNTNSCGFPMGQPCP